MSVDRDFLRNRKEEVVEDQDRKTPEEEKEVEAHSLRDPNLDPGMARGDDDDFEAHSLRDPALDPGMARGDEDDKDPVS